ncbi:MAG: aquaporin [Anaerolineae bacterium]|nr:aquaporin [Anaerolineae bacterium]
MNNALLKSSLAELIGTFVLTFVGGFAVTVAGQPENGVVVPALAHGLILCTLIYTYGHISGAHVNPAVTAGLLVGGQIKIDKAVAYWVAQFVGAIIAAVVLNALVPGTNVGQTTGSLTASAPWTAAAFEAILTFFLVSAVYQAAAYGKAGSMAGVAIGLTLTASILAGGVYTGASLNPARTFGPALIAGDLSYVLPYLVGIFAGGIIAGLVQTYILKPEK